MQFSKVKPKDIRHVEILVRQGMMLCFSLLQNLAELKLECSKNITGSHRISHFSLNRLRSFSCFQSGLSDDTPLQRKNYGLTKSTVSIVELHKSLIYNRIEIALCSPISERYILITYHYFRIH